MEGRARSICKERPPLELAEIDNKNRLANFAIVREQQTQIIPQNAKHKIRSQIQRAKETRAGKSPLAQRTRQHARQDASRAEIVAGGRTQKVTNWRRRPETEKTRESSPPKMYRSN